MFVCLLVGSLCGTEQDFLGLSRLVLGDSS